MVKIERSADSIFLIVLTGLYGAAVAAQEPQRAPELQSLAKALEGDGQLPRSSNPMNGRRMEERGTARKYGGVGRAD
jgi:hypothetical protein